MSHLPSPPLSSSSAPPNPWSTQREAWVDEPRSPPVPALGAPSLGDAGEYLNRRDLAPQKGIPRALAAAGGRPVLALQVLARVVDSSKGRDKFLKCVQYTLRTYVYLLALPLPLPLPPRLAGHRRRLALTIASLSLVRKCLLLLNPLHPLASLLAPTPMSPREMLLHLVDLAGAVADDTVCLARLGLLRRRLGHTAETWANRFWLLTTLIALCKLHFHTVPRIFSPVLHPQTHPQAYAQSRILSEREHERKATREQLKEAKWTNRKLVADLLFVSYDILDPSLPSPIRSILGEPLKCTTGLLSGLISLTKLYNQHWDASLSKG